MDHQNASASSRHTSIALHGHVADDDLRARVEAILDQARAQRAADLGEIIGVGLVAISRALVRMIHFAGRSVRASPELRVRQLLSRK